MKKLATIWKLSKTTATAWHQDKAPRLAAALAYYAIFSIAPLLIAIIWIAGLIFGPRAAQGHLVTQLQEIVGANGIAVIQTMIKDASETPAGLLTTLIGLATLLFGASSLFGQLQDALNTIWEIEPKPGGLKAGLKLFLKNRLLAFLMVLFTGFLLVLSLAASSVLHVISRTLDQQSVDWVVPLRAIDLFVPLIIITVLFAIVFKILPETRIAWSDVWLGAIITSILFTLGKVLISLYFGFSNVASIYGAASSLIILLLWIYYSAQIFLFGAEFTWVYATHFGSRAIADRA
jgi:membrane protein